MRQTIGFTLSVLAAVVLLATLYSGSASGAAAPPAKLDGKQIFLAQKCSLCHSVSSAGIERTVKSEKVAGPDLTNLAAKEDRRQAGQVPPQGGRDQRQEARQDVHRLGRRAGSR